MNRIFNCRGLTLFRWGRWRAELWLCPAGAEIPDHRHPHLDAWLTLLRGCMIWRRGEKSRMLLGPVWPLEVRAGTVHGASARTWSAFLTLEHWAADVAVTSAAVDLELA